jgi:hypothetical protein
MDRELQHEYGGQGPWSFEVIQKHPGELFRAHDIQGAICDLRDAKSCEAI